MLFDTAWDLDRRGIVVQGSKKNSSVVLCLAIIMAMAALVLDPPADVLKQRSSW